MIDMRTIITAIIIASTLLLSGCIVTLAPGYYQGTVYVHQPAGYYHHGHYHRHGGWHKR